MSMTIQKISISLPRYLTDYLAVKLGNRQMSGFIARALEEKILNDIPVGSVDTFLAHRKKLPKISYKIIRQAIERGRI